MRSNPFAGGLSRRPFLGAVRYASLLAGILALALGTPVSRASGATAGSPSEAQVKAAMLYNFAKFIEWPAGVLPPGAPVSFAIVGESRLADELEALLPGKAVNGHPVVVRRVKRLEEARHQHVVFIAAGSGAEGPKVHESLRGTHALTVEDAEGFAARGGIMNFVMEGKKVRFEINLERADSAGLKISAKLLALARIVRTGS